MWVTAPEELSWSLGKLLRMNAWLFLGLSLLGSVGRVGNLNFEGTKVDD
jgi:hypothetical protein